MTAMTKNFALIGAAGYVAPRHMKAINETGNRLLVAMDPFDSVGIIDQYAPDAKFFTEFERFDRHCEKLKRGGQTERIHYVGVASPNYLHDAHCRFALRIGADAICEKPLVLNPWNVDALQALEQETGQKIYNVLQLRLHPSVVRLKKRVDNASVDKHHNIDLKYITSRGRWYHTSWKGDIHKSGGIAANIGIHFFDMLIWIFGAVQNFSVDISEEKKMTGRLELDKASVTWHLSVDRAELPVQADGHSTWRCLVLDGEEINFSDGLSDLHTAVYKDILTGGGFSLNEARAAIELVHRLR